MKRIGPFIMCLALVITSCSEEPKALTGCDCANEINQLSTKAPNFEKCKEARKDPAFEREFVKCTAALVMHKDTSEIHLDSDKPAMNAPADGTYSMVTGKEKVLWSGMKANGKKHQGTINVKSGSVTIANGSIASGEVVIDMSTLVDTDLEGNEKSKAKLEGHLKSEDFFDVVKFPESKLTVMSTTAADGTTALSGQLTVKGKTEPVNITASISGAGETTLICSGSFQFDRSKYDVRYGSGSFFDNLGDDLIEDTISITFSVYAQRQ